MDVEKNNGTFTCRLNQDKLKQVRRREGAVVFFHIPTTDGREILLTRHTQPEPELKLLLDRLKLTLPQQPPPKITAAHVPAATPL